MLNRSYTVEETKTLDYRPAGLRDGEPIPKLLKLWEMSADQCLWAVNEGNPFLFCGHEKAVDSPYCRHHTFRAYTGASTKQEKIR